MIAEECRRKDVIHFSCHGRFDSQNPLQSGILLRDVRAGRASPEDMLTAREIWFFSNSVAARPGREPDGVWASCYGTGAYAIPSIAASLQRICAFGQGHFTRSRAFSRPPPKIWGRERACGQSGSHWVHYAPIPENWLSHQSLIMKSVRHGKSVFSATNREKNQKSLVSGLMRNL